MTRIRFIITSGSSIVLGSNIEPLASINDILNTINFRIYQQCVPYIPLSILLPLRLCIPMNEISLWTNLIANAVAAALGRNDFFERDYLYHSRVVFVSKVNRMLLFYLKVFRKVSHQPGKF